MVYRHNPIIRVYGWKKDEGKNRKCNRSPPYEFKLYSYHHHCDDKFDRHNSNEIPNVQVKK